jgi:hypothetical protein
MNILIALDQLFNTFLGGYPDETISARAYRSGNVVGMRIINFIFGDDQHCRNAHRSETLRSQLPPEYRK